MISLAPIADLVAVLAFGVFAVFLLGRWARS